MEHRPGNNLFPDGQPTDKRRTKLVAVLFIVVALVILVAATFRIRKTDVNEVGWGRRTALLKAASDGDVAEVKAQIAAGANLKAQDEWMDTALTLAAHGHPDCVKVLIAAHADIEMKGWQSRTALITAASEGDLASLKLLLEAGARVNEKDADGDTALIKAVKGGFSGCAKVLLEAHADPDVRTPIFGNSALLSAAANGSAICVKALLDAHAQVNVRDADGNTPLIAAVVNGHARCVELLIEHRADTQTKGWTKTTEPVNGFSTPPIKGNALDYATAAGRRDIVKILREARAKRDPIGLPK